MPDALHFLVLTVAGWVNRPPEDQIAYLQEEQRGLRASWPGGSVGSGACPWLAASAHPVALVHGFRALGEPRSTSWPSWRQQVHDLDMKSRVHPKSTSRFVAPPRVPVRLEFPILSLNPGLRQRCVAPDV